MKHTSINNLPNFECPVCGGWDRGDGTEDADWDPCICTDSDDSIEPMIDLYWNEKFPDTLYYLSPEGFFGLGCSYGCTRHTIRKLTAWDFTNLKEDGFERIGEL